jgi:DNA-binding MarR family transcriptional regulator
MDEKVKYPSQKFIKIGGSSDFLMAYLLVNSVPYNNDWNCDRKINKLNKKQVSEKLGISRKTLDKYLKRFEKDDYIAKTKTGYKIKNIEGFDLYVRLNSETLNVFFDSQAPHNLINTYAYLCYRWERRDETKGKIVFTHKEIIEKFDLAQNGPNSKNIGANIRLLNAMGLIETHIEQSDKDSRKQVNILDGFGYRVKEIETVVVDDSYLNELLSRTEENGRKKEITYEEAVATSRTQCENDYAFLYEPDTEDELF